MSTRVELFEKAAKGIQEAFTNAVEKACEEYGLNDAPHLVCEISLECITAQVKRFLEAIEGDPRLSTEGRKAGDA